MVLRNESSECCRPSCPWGHDGGREGCPRTRKQPRAPHPVPGASVLGLPGLRNGERKYLLCPGRRSVVRCHGGLTGPTQTQNSFTTFSSHAKSSPPNFFNSMYLFLSSSSLSSPSRPPFSFSLFCLCLYLSFYGRIQGNKRSSNFFLARFPFSCERSEGWNHERYKSD